MKPKSPLRLACTTLLAACAASPPAPDAASPGLVGPVWALVEIQSMDERVFTPGAPDRFTLRFLESGEVEVKVHCNRGSGRWEGEGPSQLRLGPLATTRAFCGPDSLHDRFLSDLSAVRSYVLRGGRLYLATLADGAILEFRRLGEGEGALARGRPLAAARPGSALSFR